MACPVCRRDNPPESVVCAGCGAPLAAGCPLCGARPPANASFCNQCGTPLDPSRPPHHRRETTFPVGAQEGERKQVTVLFADLKGSMDLMADTDPEDAGKILDTVLEHMMDAVRRYEGTVNQVMGDGIMAIFGAPVAHEDHALRACHAALQMQEALSRHSEAAQGSLGVPLLIRVGVNSGEVVVRSMGSNLRMDYTAIGQTTHLAARMEQLARPGSVLVTAETLRLADGHVQAKPIGKVAVKGLSAPVDVYELTGIDLARSRMAAFAARGMTHFVGREAERERLRRARQQTAAGSGTIVGVMGDPGVGKTRLFYEFMRECSAEGWLVLATSAVSYGKSTPYLPVVDLLRTYFDLDDRDDPRRVREKIAVRVGELDPELEPLLPVLHGVLDVAASDPDPGAAKQDPPHRRRQILDVLVKVFLAESRRRPLCMVVENLHWIDLETQAFLDGLVDAAPRHRLFLLLNYRPEYRAPWASTSAFSAMRMDPLSPALADELLHALLGSDPTLRSLRQLMIDRADGNPFFLEEMVRSLVETEALAGVRGAYRLVRPVSAVRVPETVKALLASRIDRLPYEDERLLHCAAVVGRHVDVSLLRPIAEISEGQLRAGLAHLQAAGFLYESRRFPDQEYTFRHALTHDVAYGSLLHTRQRALHARIVTAIETIYADRLGEHTERLADHAFRGEVWDKAVEYLLRAGRRALFASATREAVENFDRALLALRRLPSTPRTLRTAVALRLNLRDPLWSLGEIGRIRDELDEIEPLAHQLDDRRALATVAAYRCHYLWAVGELEAAGQAGEQALAIAVELDDVLLVAETKLYQGLVLFAQGDCGIAVDLWTETLRTLDQASTTQVSSSNRAAVIRLLVGSFLTRGLAELGRFAEGLALGERAPGVGTPSTAFGQVTGLAGLGILHVRRGDAVTAIPLLERGLEVCRTYSFTNWLPTIQATLSAAYGLAGRVDESVLLLEEAVDLNRRTGIVATQSLWRAYLAEAYLRAGRFAEALAEARRALDECRGRREHGYEPWALQALARVLAGGRLDEAAEAPAHYLEAIKLAEQRGMTPLVVHCFVGLARLSERTGDQLAATSHRQHARQLAARLGMLIAPLEAA